MASLFKVGGGKSPRRVIQLSAPDGTRPTIHLGRVGYEQARVIKSYVEALASAKWMNVAPDPAVSAWVGGLSDEMHEKLHKAGLIDPREPEPKAPALKGWLDRYVESRSDLKPRSLVNLRRTVELLTEFFTDGRRIDTITIGDAADWRAFLLRKGLAEASVRLYARITKGAFNAAVDHEYIHNNPFKRLPSRSLAAERTRYITPAETDKILTVCPTVQWKALFGLARLAGLRAPSEIRGLEWGDIDFERGRMIVKSPKTERFEGKAARVVPIVPRLQKILQEAFLDDAADPKNVITIGTSPGTLHSGLRTIIRRAGIVPWPNLFRALRQSRATEWAETFPGHAVAAWMGHSETVSKAHYLMTPDHLFDAAAGIGQPAPEDPADRAADRAAKEQAERPGTRENGREHPIDDGSADDEENAVFACSGAENGGDTSGQRAPHAVTSCNTR